jgi:growth arrest-specific protein 8
MAPKKKGKKTKSGAPLVPIPDDLAQLSAVELREHVEALQTKISRAMQDRAYMQVERDMAARVLDVCRAEIDGVRDQQLILDESTEEATDDHQSKLKAYQHRAIALSAESQTIRTQTVQETTQRVEQYSQAHTRLVAETISEKVQLIKTIDKEQRDHDEEIANLRVTFATNLAALRDQFEQQHRMLENQLHSRHSALDAELDLRHRVEVHELEERKNQHLADLHASHQEAFAQIRAYYKEITVDNVELIRKLKSEIEKMRSKEKIVQQTNHQLTLENKSMSDPMAKIAEEKSRLSGRIQLHGNNLSALRNLGMKHLQVEKDIKETRREIHRLEDRLKRTEKEKDETVSKFERGISEVQKVTQLRNTLLHKKIEELERIVPYSQPATIPVGVSISDLEYEFQEVTKSLIDTNHVLDAKLRTLGHPPLDQGLLEDMAAPGISHGPADLVGE